MYRGSFAHEHSYTNHCAPATRSQWFQKKSPAVDNNELTTATPTCDWKGTVTDVVVTVRWEVGKSVLMASMDELATATCVW